MKDFDGLLSAMTLEDMVLINGGSPFSDWVCEKFGQLCSGLAQGNGADVCGRAF